MQTKIASGLERSGKTDESDDDCLCESDLADLGCFEHFRRGGGL